jgi:hypothetical protein
VSNHEASLINTPIPIWTCAAFHPAYLCGGWAFVRAGAGAAGGERRTTASRMALTGLAGALRDVPPGAEVEIRTTSPELALFAPVLETLGQKSQIAPPEDDLDLWARIITAATGRRLTLILSPLEPGGPAAFVAAWADLARDKAKATGPFTAAIPKANLAKVAGLGAR